MTTLDVETDAFLQGAAVAARMHEQLHTWLDSELRPLLDQAETLGIPRPVAAAHAAGMLRDAADGLDTTRP